MGWQGPYWKILGSFSSVTSSSFFQAAFLWENKENKWVISLSYVGWNFFLRTNIVDSEAFLRVVPRVNPWSYDKRVFILAGSIQVCYSLNFYIHSLGLHWFSYYVIFSALYKLSLVWFCLDWPVSSEWKLCELFWIVIGCYRKKVRDISSCCRGGRSRILTTIDRGGGHFNLGGRN